MEQKEERKQEALKKKAEVAERKRVRQVVKIEKENAKLQKQQEKAEAKAQREIAKQETGQPASKKQKTTAAENIQHVATAASSKRKAKPAKPLPDPTNGGAPEGGKGKRGGRPPKAKTHDDNQKADRQADSTISKQVASKADRATKAKDGMMLLREAAVPGLPLPGEDFDRKHLAFEV